MASSNLPTLPTLPTFAYIVPHILHVLLTIKYKKGRLGWEVGHSEEIYMLHDNPVLQENFNE